MAQLLRSVGRVSAGDFVTNFSVKCNHFPGFLCVGYSNKGGERGRNIFILNKRPQCRIEWIWKLDVPPQWPRGMSQNNLGTSMQPLYT